jgi:hypothetical protein
MFNGRGSIFSLFQLGEVPYEVSTRWREMPGSASAQQDLIFTEFFIYFPGIAQQGIHLIPEF